MECHLRQNSAYFSSILFFTVIYKYHGFLQITCGYLQITIVFYKSAYGYLQITMAFKLGVRWPQASVRLVS